MSETVAQMIDREEGRRVRQTHVLYVDRAMHELCMDTFETSCDTHSRTPVQIHEIDGKLLYGYGGMWDDDPNGAALCHEVVPESQFDGPTTSPEEWEARGVFTKVGCRILGTDMRFYVVISNDEFQIRTKA